MCTKNSLVPTILLVVSLVIASLLPTAALALTSVTATKDCSLGPPCTVTPASFTIHFPQTISWQANYLGSGTQGNDFYIHNSSNSNLIEFPLSTNLASGFNSGTLALAAGTYAISITYFGMGPGSYTITFDASSSGEPHITTVDGNHYDFQAVGEFVLLRQANGLEIQARQAAIPTTYSPGPDPHDSLALCVSINTAVAARVAKHRVTYEPSLSGVPDPTGLQLRVDGALTSIGAGWLDLGNGGRITRTSAPGGLKIDFPDQTVLFVTPGWWADQNKWYLNLDIVPTRAGSGLAGVFPRGSWLPALPNGGSMGPMPASTHDRYIALYQTFADAWRVTKGNSLFDYAPGTSTDTFTDRNWPSEHGPCTLAGTVPAEPVSEHIARQACQGVIGENANCVFDVMVTGNPGFAVTYALSQSVQATPAVQKPCGRTLVFILAALLLLALILLLLCLQRHHRREREI